MDNGLAERLKRDTRELHGQAERSGVMADLLHGRIGAPAYGALLRNLHAIYAALDEVLAQAMEGANAPLLQALQEPALRRAASLARDLDCLHPDGWQRLFPVEPATAAYEQRLHGPARHEPRLLVAHAYVRYLGDLHGGQVLQQIVQRRFALAGDDGTRFYRFGPPAEVERLRQAFRAGLAALPVSPADVDAIVAEACWAFEAHKTLFVELRSRYAEP